MSPTRRAAFAVAVASCVAFIWIPAGVGAVIAVLTAVVLDAMRCRGEVSVTRMAPTILSRGVPDELNVEAFGPGTLTVRQPVEAGLSLRADTAEAKLTTSIVASVRGRHVLAPAAVRVTGPLGLASKYHQHVGVAAEVIVYPDLPAARKLAVAVRRGVLRATGGSMRGSLGLGTDFESIRDYLPDDDIRQVNWQATQRAGKPMSNTYRVEEERDVICMCDTGRLMAAPLADRTRVDVMVDAVSAVAMVSEQVGDRCGVICFDSKVNTVVPPSHRGADAVIRSVFDLSATRTDTDFERAVQRVASRRRALIVLFTDLLDEASAQLIAESVAVIGRRHMVVVATCADPELDAVVRTAPTSTDDVHAAAVALDVLAVRARAAELVRSAGATVLEAGPGSLGLACVRAYLNTKSRVSV